MRDTNNPIQSEELLRRNPSACASENVGGLSEDAIVQIVSECRAGNGSAQRQLYESYCRQIYRLMVRMVNAEAAADLTQQVFLQVFRKIDQYVGKGRFDRWLYRLAVNEAYQHLRRKRRDRHTTLVYEPVDTSVGGDRRTEQKDLMEQALARLDPELRSMFLLREVEELSHHELAETLDIPEGTVGSRLNRARRELRDHLVNLGWEL
jgi:RNA polymerase sigma-70 factor (ECF subfamily)